MSGNRSPAPVGEYRRSRIGPGAIVGERAYLEAGTRTATVTAASPCRMVAVDPGLYRADLVREVAGNHQREKIASA